MLLETSPFVKAHRLQLRVTFVKDDRRVEYGLIEFGVDAMGSEQMRLISKGTLPLEFTVTLRVPTRTAQFSFSGSYLGHEIREIAKAQNALDIARSGGSVELFDLASQQPLGRLEANAEELANANAKDEILSSFVRDAQTAAVALGQKIVWARDLRPEDVQNAAILAQIVRTGSLRVEATAFHAEVNPKQIEELSALVKAGTGGFFQRLAGATYPVLDAQLDAGPHNIYFVPSEVVEEKKTPSGMVWVRVSLKEPLGFVFSQFSPAPAAG